MVIDDIHYTQNTTNGDKKILGKCLEFFIIIYQIYYLLFFHEMLMIEVSEA